MGLLLLELSGTFQSAWLWDLDLTIEHKEDALCHFLGPLTPGSSLSSSPNPSSASTAAHAVPPGLVEFLRYVYELDAAAEVDYARAAACLDPGPKGTARLRELLVSTGFTAAAGEKPG